MDVTTKQKERDNIIIDSCNAVLQQLSYSALHWTR